MLWTGEVRVLYVENISLLSSMSEGAHIHHITEIGLKIDLLYIIISYELHFVVGNIHQFSSTLMTVLMHKMDQKQLSLLRFAPHLSFYGT